MDMDSEFSILVCDYHIRCWQDCDKLAALFCDTKDGDWSKPAFICGAGVAMQINGDAPTWKVS